MRVVTNKKKKITYIKALYISKQQVKKEQKNQFSKEKLLS
jgi:hypothetical protein